MASSCGSPATEADAVMSRKRRFNKSNICVKCKVNTGRVVIRHSVYCKDCFFANITGKFRRSLEPSLSKTPGLRKGTLKASGNLLVGLSGGVGSAVLLDLVSRCYLTAPGAENVKGGTDHPRNATVWPKVAVCYVETCSAYPGTRDRTEEVKSIVEGYKGVDFISLRIEDAFDQNWWRAVGGKALPSELGIDLATEALLLSSTENTDPVSSFRSYIASLPTQTAIPSTLQTLIRLLLLHTANSTKSSHLLLGTSLTSLSISLISSISQGGGFVVREEADEDWSPSDNFAEDIVGRRRHVVHVMRPLKDVGMKECAIWLWWNDLKVIGRTSSTGGKQDISALTKDFIVGLERDYPSTVSTIARTCGKLAPKEGSTGRCSFCERPVQSGVQEWKARISIRSYAEMDAHPTPPRDATEMLSSSSLSLTPHLCYSCHTTMTSRSSRGNTTVKNQPYESVNSVVLPVWVQSHLIDDRDKLGEDGEIWAGRKLGISDMAAAVSDFLLGD